MKKVILIISFIFIGFESYTQNIFFKTDSCHRAVLTCGAVTSDGGYVMGGYHFWGDYPGDRELLWIKYNSNGDTSFSKKAGIGYESEVYNCWGINKGGFALDIFYNTGTYGYGSLLAFDSTGNAIWSLNGGPSGDCGGYFTCCQPTRDGGCLIGYIMCNIQLYAGYIIKVDSTGNIIYSKVLGYYIGGMINTVRETNDGGFIATGRLDSAYISRGDVNGNVLWQKTYSANDAIQADDGKFILVGDSGTSTCITRLDSGGNYIDSRTYDGLHGLSIKKTLDEGFIISTQKYFFKTDINLNIQWAKHINNGGGIFEPVIDGGYAHAGGGIIIKTDMFGNSYCNDSVVVPVVNFFTTSASNAQLLYNQTDVDMGTGLNGINYDSVYVISICDTVETCNLNVSHQNCTCYQSCDGSVHAAVFGIPPFQYLWSTGNTTQNVSGLCSGTYFVTMTDSSGCSLSDSVIITEPPPPVLTDSVIYTPASCDTCCDGSATVAILSGNGSYTYLWTPDNQTTATATGLCAGNYYICITQSGGCEVCKSFTITFNTGIDKLSYHKNFSIEPNPTSGTFTLSYNSQLSIHNSQLKIYDVLGQEVYTQPITNPNQTTITISQLSNGVYFYQLINTQETYRGKFVKSN